MRVVMVVWNDFRHDARVLKEAETLQSAGYQVVVHALHTPGVTAQKEVLSSGVEVVRVALNPFGKSKRKSVAVLNRSLFNQLARIVMSCWAHICLIVQMVRARPDVVHGHDVNTLPTAWVVSLITRAPLIYDAHEISTAREGYASLRKFVAWIEKRLMPRASGTITTTKTRAKFFARAYKIPRPLVLQNRPKHSCVDVTDKIRDELGLKELWPIVLYQGGLQPGRGLERLIYSAQDVKNAYFVLIGGGAIDGHLRNLAKELKLTNKVFFIPTVELSELPYYTASADIGVQPIENTCLNHFSTDSNKLFEYIIAGLPVISSDLPEIRNVIRNNELGLLVPPGNTSALSLAIEKLVRDEHLRDFYHRNTVNAARSLNWESQERDLIVSYDNVIAKCS